MIVDTSVWVVHLRKIEPRLGDLLEDGVVMIHPFIIGELACGNLRNRVEVLDLLSSLPQASVVQHNELLSFVDQERLHGRGIGWIDVHLLAAARLSGQRLWTHDRRLQQAAAFLGVAP
ncbi:MAG: type II toxin-antitoxin system VapC family toxin [Actinomycetota bacterium]